MLPDGIQHNPKIGIYINTPARVTQTMEKDGFSCIRTYKRMGNT
jgi:hypothetical protein